MMLRGIRDIDLDPGTKLIGEAFGRGHGKKRLAAQVPGAAVDCNTRSHTWSQFNITNLYNSGR